MFRYTTLILGILLLNACNVGDSMREASKSNPITHARVIAADNGCMGCHAVAVTVVGPAWKLVAKRYQNKPDARNFLIHKIKNGGKGNWNDITGGKSMPAQDGIVTDADIEKLVDYILSL